MADGRLILLREGRGLPDDRPIVLVVANDTGTVQTIRDTLEAEGLLAVGITHGDQVAAVARSTHPAVLVMDLMLGGTTGIELAAELRNDGFAQVPIVALSASPYLAEVAEETAIFQAVLTEPIDFDELVTIICELLPA